MTPPTAATRWAYHLLEGRWDSDFVAALNAAGADGWMVVGMSQGPIGPKVLVGKAY